MTTLLVRPEGPQFYKTIGPDLGFGYLETALAGRGRRVRIVDLMKSSPRTLAETIARERFDLIGFKLYSKDTSAFRRLAGSIAMSNAGLVSTTRNRNGVALGSSNRPVMVAGSAPATTCSAVRNRPRVWSMRKAVPCSSEAFDPLVTMTTDRA